METWSTHDLFQKAQASLDSNRALQLRLYAQHLIARRLPVVFSLGHLARITGVSYAMLHETVCGKRELSNYKMYAVAKRSGGRRFIHAVSPNLLRVQDFLNKEILQACTPHGSSFAFHRSGGLMECASMHCKARWLFQFDLKDFFYNIDEIDVYAIYSGLGYRPLLAFELARLCTTRRLPRGVKTLTYYIPKSDHSGFGQPGVLGKDRYWVGTALAYPERTGFLGVLPQGAPTSPMLSNLVARQLDCDLHEFAQENGLVYTRYADDITVSGTEISRKRGVGHIMFHVQRLIKKNGFRVNPTKTRAAGPGSKKLVLGLLVDGERPRLSRETYRRIDHHLYSCERFGIEEAAKHAGFESAYGYVNHIQGLVAFVKAVDTPRWGEFNARLRTLQLPW